MKTTMNQKALTIQRAWLTLFAAALTVASGGYAQETKRGSSYSPVDIKEDFATTMARMSAEKPAVMKRQMDLLNER